MKTLAKAARAAHASAVAYKPNERGGYSFYCFYCCNALAHEAMRLNLWPEERNRLEDLFEDLFGDAAFWVGTDSSSRSRPTQERSWYHYGHKARHADRIDALDLFATILESGDD